MYNKRTQCFGGAIMDEHNNLNKKYGKIEETPTASNTNEEKVVLKKEKIKPIKEKKVKAPKEKKVKEPKPPKEKKVKEPKPPKEKKVKEPKPPKEKKVKEPKPPKEKKVKAPKPPKEKKIKEPKAPKEKKPREPMTTKDYVTIAIAVVAVILAAGVLVLKFYPRVNNPTDSPEATTKAPKMGEIQIERGGMPINLVQSDLPDVFYGFTPNYQLQYYQYRDNKMTPVQSTGKITTEVDLGNEKIPATIEYVQLGGEMFGIGLFRADEHKDVYFYDKVVFKLVNLPAQYAEEGKALLLVSTNGTALAKNDVLWTESFVVDLKTGETKRFLKNINRTMDMNGAGVSDFCIMTKNSYTTEKTLVPFISAREYEAGSNKFDIFVKEGAKERIFATDIYGKYFLIDGDGVIFLRKTKTGFDAIRKTGETEEIIQSFHGSINTEYLYEDEYIFNKSNGKLFNLKTGEEKTVMGYRMTPNMITVSPDGKYLVMLGTVHNVVDYQVHIFNLETGDYSKYIDQNYSEHFNLSFVNNTTLVYTAIDPSRGFEYVILDASKVK